MQHHRPSARGGLPVPAAGQPGPGTAPAQPRRPPDRPPHTQREAWRCRRSRREWQGGCAFRPSRVGAGLTPEHQMLRADGQGGRQPRARPWCPRRPASLQTPACRSPAPVPGGLPGPAAGLGHGGPRLSLDGGAGRCICSLLQKVSANVIHLQINFSASGWVSNKRGLPPSLAAPGTSAALGPRASADEDPAARALPGGGGVSLLSQQQSWQGLAAGAPDGAFLSQQACALTSPCRHTVPHRHAMSRRHTVPH